MATQSPFITHRDKVLGHYSTASWLRRVVMSLYNGSGHPVGLSPLTNTDAAHFAAFQEMVNHYRCVGENDPALHALVEEIQKRGREEQAAEERSLRLEDWNSDARRQLRALGLSSDVVDDRYSWFEARFDAGRTADDVVAEFAARPSK